MKFKMIIITILVLRLNCKSMFFLLKSNSLSYKSAHVQLYIDDIYIVNVVTFDAYC